MLKKIKKLKVVKVVKPKLKKAPIHAIGRRIRGLIRSCDSCGAKMQEVFKIHQFSASGSDKTSYYCRRCYVRILRRPKEF